MADTDFTRNNCGLVSFTPQQKKVIALLKTNLSYRQIAKNLGMHYQTVKNHAMRIYQRAGARSREHFIGMLLLPLDSPLRREIPCEEAQQRSIINLKNQHDDPSAPIGRAREESPDQAGRCRQTWIYPPWPSFKPQLPKGPLPPSLPLGPIGQKVPAPKTRAEKIALLMRKGHSYLSAVDALDVSA